MPGLRRMRSEAAPPIRSSRHSTADQANRRSATSAMATRDAKGIGCNVAGAAAGGARIPCARVRRARSRLIAFALLAAGPTVLAFFSGGYFDGAARRRPPPWPGRSCSRSRWPVPSRCPRALPAGWRQRRARRPGRLERRSRLPGRRSVEPAMDSVQRLLLYLAVLLRRRGGAPRPAPAPAVEPALAAGALLVIGYGLAGRLVPGHPRAEPLVRGRRAARAADHLLERRGAAGGDGLPALRPPGRGSRPVAGPLRLAAAAACAAAGRWASTSRTRAARWRWP